MIWMQKGVNDGFLEWPARDFPRVNTLSGNWERNMTVNRGVV